MQFFYLHYISKYDILSSYFNWPVGEVVNTSPSQGDIHGFEPRTGYHVI